MPVRGSESVVLGRLLDLHADPSRRETLAEQLARPDRFVARQTDDLNLGISSQATWLRLKVRNPGPEPVDWYLDLGDGLIDEATIHEINSEGAVRSRTTGTMHPWSSRDVPLSQIVFALREPAASERTLYVRVVAGFGKRLMLRAHSPEKLPRVTQWQSTVSGALLGVFAGVGCYHFLLFVLLKDMAYFWHSGLMLMALLSRMLIRSFGLESIWPEGFPGYGALNLVVTSGIFICALMFSRKVLPLDDIARRWVSLLSGLRWCWLAVLAVCVGWPGAEASHLVTLVGLFTQVVVLLAAVAAWRTGSVVARWFLPAWLVLIAGGLAWTARNLGWLPFNDWTSIVGSTGLALHNLLLSVALATRLREEQDKRLQAQQQLAESRRLSNLQLERRVEERTQELQAARDRAESVAQMKDQMVRLVSHDLRSPLASIVAASERLGNSGPSGTAAVGIRQTARGLIRLIDRLLNLNNLRSGALQLRRSWVPLRSLAHQQVAALEGLIQQRGLKVNVDVPEEARVMADPILLAEVVANLLGNAVKAVGEGGRIRLSLTPQGDGLVIEDDGPGFAAAKSFWPPGGHGLGLQHCREILKAHGGQLAIDEPGNGARVRLHLPAEGPRVLVVDDQPVQRALLTEAVQASWPASQVVRAVDGLDGWSQLQTQTFDVALIDCQMPGLDGLGLLRRIRATAATQGLPVLMLTSVASPEDAERARRECLVEGADAFLTKPVEDQAMAQTLQSLLRPDEDAEA